MDVCLGVTPNQWFISSTFLFPSTASSRHHGILFNEQPEERKMHPYQEALNYVLYHYVFALEMYLKSCLL